MKNIDVINIYWERILKRKDGIRRMEFEIIIDWVMLETRVLDLGCGDGTLGRRLVVEKKCVVNGIDISEVAVKKAAESSSKLL